MLLAARNRAWTASGGLQFTISGVAWPGPGLFSILSHHVLRLLAGHQLPEIYNRTGAQSPVPFWLRGSIFVVRRRFIAAAVIMPRISPAAGQTIGKKNFTVSGSRKSL